MCDHYGTVMRKDTVIHTMHIAITFFFLLSFSLLLGLTDTVVRFSDHVLLHARTHLHAFTVLRNARADFASSPVFIN